MTPRPAVLGGTEPVAWRLDQETYRATWDSGEGSCRFGVPGFGQQQFGDRVPAAHRFVPIPSAVSPHSRTLLSVAAGAYAVRFQERFALDRRLRPPRP